MRWPVILFPAVFVALSASLYYGTTHANLADIVGSRLTKNLGREVHIAQISLKPGLWLGVDVKDASLANIPNGSRPDMMSLKTLHAEIRLSSLFSGPIALRHVVISGYSGLFERTSDRTPNWRFKTPETASQPAPHPEPDLSGLPSTRDVRITDSEIIYRTSGGQTYTAHLTDLTLSSERDDAPVNMHLSGAYNQTPLTITATLAPWHDLRLVPRPYATDARVTTGDVQISFVGSLTDPMDFEGVQGRVHVDSPTSQALLQLAGLSDIKDDIALDLEGHFAHQKNDWVLSQARGNIKGSQLKSGDITFIEGASKQSDAVQATLAFARIDANSLLAGLAPDAKPRQKNRTAHADIPLIIPTAPDPLIDLHLSIDDLTYNTLTLQNLTLDTAQTAGSVKVSRLSVTYLGTALDMTGTISAADQGADITATAKARHGEIDRLRKVAGLPPIPVKGLLNIDVSATAQHARTLDEAVAQADIFAAVSIEKGEIAREIVEAASMDLRLIFRRPKAPVPITCMLGVLEIHQGQGTVVPLRIRTPAGVVAAKATFSLKTHQFDMVFASRPFSTSFFALDIPLRVRGPFNAPSLRLAAFSREGKALLAASNAAVTLPPTLQSFARPNACLNPTR